MDETAIIGLSCLHPGGASLAGACRAKSPRNRTSVNGSRRTTAAAPTGEPRTAAMRAPRLVSLALLLVMAVALVGCGDGRIKCYLATGKVQVGDKPIEGVRVMLVPVGGGEKFKKERPFGITDQNGNFTLTTFIKGDGAPAGEYKVMIRKGRPKSAEEAKRRAKGPKLSRQYGRPDTSSVTATIEETENNELLFELKPPENPRSRSRR